MTPVQRDEILGLAEYEEVRQAFRRRIIDLKNVRRVLLGKNMSAVFENRDTVLFQIQEMLRTERITREDAILHEMETYNELIPATNELSATLFVEYPDSEERERMLAALVGLEDKFYVSVDGRRFAARNETRGTRSDRTTAVHYVKFPLDGKTADDIRSGDSANVVLGVEHAKYTAAAVLSPALLAELRADLS